jgi:hypothetical protein
MKLWRVLCAGQGERPGGEVEALENAGRDGGAEDAGHHPARATAGIAGEDVLPERPLQQLGKRHAGGAWRLGGGWRNGRGTGDHQRPEASAGSQHAEEADEVDAGRRDERGEAPEKGQRGQHQLGGAGGGRALHAVANFPVREKGKALEAERAPRTVVADSLQSRPVVLMHPGVGVQGEALQEGAAPAPPGARLVQGERERIAKESRAEQTGARESTQVPLL